MGFLPSRSLETSKKYISFSLLVLVSMYIFWGKCIYFSIFEWWNSQLCVFLTYLWILSFKTFDLKYLTTWEQENKSERKKEPQIPCHKPKYQQSFSLVLNSESQSLPNVFSWDLNISKLLVIEEVGGDNFYGFIFLWVRKDEIFVNFKLANHKDDWMQEFKQT